MKTQHRWKQSLGPQQIAILEDAAEALRQAWEWDREHPKTYPVNTDHALWETTLQLRGKARERKTTKLPAYRRPKCLDDFIDEPVIKRLYEQQHSGSYQDALERAADGFGEGLIAWKEIVNFLVPAYLLGFAGEESLPKPRVNFLHRELLEIARSLELDQLTPEGIAEFLDEICPCGKEHNADTIWKLKKRIEKTRRRRAKVQR